MDFSHITVLAVGDVMLDRFVEGEIERISPEAPVPVLRLSRTREMPGGVGNVASNIASLGAHAILATTPRPASPTPSPLPDGSMPS